MLQHYPRSQMLAVAVGGGSSSSVPSRCMAVLGIAQNCYTQRYDGFEDTDGYDRKIQPAGRDMYGTMEG